MEKALWHFHTIGHILQNCLYCGERECRKEYVPDYLEQKRAKNRGELDRIIVEGKHQPIVTYAYKCYSQNQTGTVSARRKNGLSTESICPVALVQGWKPNATAQKVCSVRYFLIVIYMGYCHNGIGGQSFDANAEGTIPLTTGKTGKGGIAYE